MIKVAILSGRPADGTLLPKQEKHVWKEIQRVLKDDLSNLGEGFEYLIPIYNKFDLEALRIADKNGNKVTYYLPNEDWGKSKLPAFQINLVSKMRNSGTEVIVPGSMMARIYKMIEDADVVYFLDETDGFERFKDALSKKAVMSFSKDKMLYKTEEEAIAYHEKLKETTPIFITPSQLNALEDAQLELNLSDKEVDVEEMLRSVYHENDVDDNPFAGIHTNQNAMTEHIDQWLSDLEN